MNFSEIVIQNHLKTRYEGCHGPSVPILIMRRPSLAASTAELCRLESCTWTICCHNSFSPVRDGTILERLLCSALISDKSSRLQAAGISCNFRMASSMELIIMAGVLSEQSDKEIRCLSLDLVANITV